MRIAKNVSSRKTDNELLQKRSHDIIHTFSETSGLRTWLYCQIPSLSCMFSSRDGYVFLYTTRAWLYITFVIEEVPQARGLRSQLCVKNCCQQKQQKCIRKGSKAYWELSQSFYRKGKNPVNAFSGFLCSIL